MINFRGFGVGFGRVILGVMLAVSVSRTFGQTEAPKQDAGGESRAIRSGVVQLDAARLTSLNVGDTLTLDLFEDTVLPITVDATRQSTVDTMHVQGRVDGNPQSRALFVVHKGIATGKVHVPSVGDFSIRTNERGEQVVEEIDLAAYPPCGCGEQHVVNAQGGVGAPGANDAGIAGGPPTCGGSFIDMMVVYTPEAQSQQGGNAQIEARIVLAIDEINSIYANSGITSRIRLVYKGEIDYSETGSFFSEIDNLTGTNDGLMDEVHALRDQYAADLVSLIISHTQEGTICGVGWLMQPAAPGFQEYGFNVNNADCTFNTYTLPHEIGHNQGCAHDRDNGAGGGAYPFSYGHRFTALDDGIEYRTVMSYAPGSRVPHFSNPDIAYLGTATGLPEADPLSADNVRSINLTAPIVSAFRTGAPPTSYAPPVAVDSPVELEAGDRFGVSVALDGDFAIVGAYTDDGVNNLLSNAGAAYLYRRDAVSNAWIMEQKIAAIDAGANDRFGVSVDIVAPDADHGAVAIVGAYLDDAPGRNTGSAYVFRRSSSGTWTQEQKLTSIDLANGDLFGEAVAITRFNGIEFGIVGAYLANSAQPSIMNDTGASYIFTASGATWTQTAKLELPVEHRHTGDNFGFSVAIDSSVEDAGGEMLAVVGAWKDDGANGDFTDAGAAYVFAYDSSNWVLQSRLVADDRSAGDELGYAVDLDVRAGDDLVVAGAWKDDGAFINSGAAYVFSNVSDTWPQQAKLLPSGAAENDQFGNAVTVNGDYILVGCSLDDGPLPVGLLDTGSAQAFRQAGVGWIFEGMMTGQSLQGDEFGFDVAIDNERILISAWEADIPNPPNPDNVDEGRIYISGTIVTNDCNSNGVDDLCDISSGTSTDVNANGIPDECDVPPSTCPGDVAFPPDGLVNVDDLLTIINNWGNLGGPGDANGNGIVNVDDLLTVINGWGICPPPG